MILREMLVDDLDQVMEIEEELFSVPWTKEGFLTFLMKENAMFLVVEEKGRILGYCGLLTVLDEGDVTNVAVRRDRQREGIGNFLMESMIRLAEERGITMIHLEVRAGNETAIRLYANTINRNSIFGRKFISQFHSRLFCPTVYLHHITACPTQRTSQMSSHVSGTYQNYLFYHRVETKYKITPIINKTAGNR